MTGKLYWRIKKNGKWTWSPAEILEECATYVIVDSLEEE